MLLIGSHALNYRLGKIREPVDIDYIGTFEELVEYQKKHKENIESIIYESDKKVTIKRKDCIVEFEVAYEGESGFDALSFGGEKILFDGTAVTVPDINALFEIKSSHRYLKDSPHFLKTMNDRLLLKEAGAQIINKEFLSKREKETYTYKHPKLNVNKYNFFKDDNIKYIYDHDTIHISMAHKEKPAYMYFKPEDKEVMVSRSMWDSLDEETKIYSIVEESYVLALERSQIPHPNVLTPLQSFELALMKVCTSITSGWWREYAYDHYYYAHKLYNPFYVTNFWEAVDKGIVKLLQPH